MEQQDELTGIIERIVFHNNENGYTVFMLKTRGTAITITGSFPSLKPGQGVVIKGSWTQHPKFGKQFSATTYSLQLPTTEHGLKKYLGSGLIKGIGPVFAEKIVKHFGTKTLDIIDQEPERLRHVSGIGKGRIEKIINAWRDQKAVASIMVFLQDKDISPVYATKIYKRYGNASVAVLEENPYRLTEDIWGIGFKSADAIAQSMGFEKTSLKRMKACIIFSITETIGNGHLYTEIDELKKNALSLLELEGNEHKEKAKRALYELHDADKIKVITQKDRHYTTLSRFYYSEQGVAHRLQKFIAHRSSLTCDMNEVYKTLRTAGSGNNDKGVTLNEDQQRGIIASFLHKISVITGGPGTGKTTLIRQLLDILDQYRIDYRLAAPTGRAAKRMMEGTGRHATTIHRLLEFDVSSMSCRHNENNALKTELLIIDETSMVDIFLAHAIIKALPLSAHVVFIGDTDQLPAVGAGNFLLDLIESGIAPTIKLTHIFRQAQNSMIIVNAHRVNAGEFPKSYIPDAKRDFFFIKEDKPENVLQHIKDIYSSRLKNFAITPSQTQILVPMNRGSIGTQTLNHQIQQFLNPEPSTHIMFSGTVFKNNDRVMQIRNNYDKGVFNGDMGIIQEVDQEEQTLIVRFYDKLVVTYESSELNELVHAYAISIHKSQGSEYGAVIIPIFMQHFVLLQRNLIYTAITRAKKLCILIGQPKAIAMAVNKHETIKRITFLKEFLTTNLRCR